MIKLRFFSVNILLLTLNINPTQMINKLALDFQISHLLQDQTRRVMFNDEHQLTQLRNERIIQVRSGSIVGCADYLFGSFQSRSSSLMMFIVQSYQNFIRTISVLYQNFINALSELYQNYIRAILELYQNYIRTILELYQCFIRTLLELY